jgi:hypothetical protein
MDEVSVADTGQSPSLWLLHAIIKAVTDPLDEFGETV